MRRDLCTGFIILLLLACGTVAACANGSADQDNTGNFWAPVEKALGTNGEHHPDGSITLDVPRNLSVSLNGIRLASGSDLSHEIRMQRAGNKTIAVGELVLKEDEIGSVTQRLRATGISETALHNHLLHETPRLMYLHFHAYGDPVNITTALSDIIAPMGKGPVAEFEGRGIDTSRLDRTMRTNGKADAGVYAFMFPRRDNITVSGTTLSPYMDISSDVSFQPLGEGNALVNGELVLESGEVQPAIDMLSRNGFEIDAVHSHMLTEQPRLFYLHCWATGNAEQLARGMREALDRTNSLT
jgi:hypothetical protein